MKKLIVLITATFFFINAHSQNLQFSRVILIDGTGNSLVTHTVPAGKIWEIKSWDVGSNKRIGINNKDFQLIYSGSTINNAHPVWLPENTTIQVGLNPSTGDPQPTVDFLSIVEYTIVP